MVVAAIGGSLACARRGWHFCNQFWHPFVPLFRVLTDVTLAKHPGDYSARLGPGPGGK